MINMNAAQERKKTHVYEATGHVKGMGMGQNDTKLLDKKMFFFFFFFSDQWDHNDHNEIISSIFLSIFLQRLFWCFFSPLDQARTAQEEMLRSRTDALVAKMEKEEMELIQRQILSSDFSNVASWFVTLFDRTKVYDKN